MLGSRCKAVVAVRQYIALLIETIDAAGTLGIHQVCGVPSAGRIEDAINRDFGAVVARMTDAGTVAFHIGASGLDSPAHALRRIENLRVAPDTRARVVIDQSSGTIVMGQDVRISRVAVSQGNLTLRVDETPVALQPNPFSAGQTIVLPRTSATIESGPDIMLAEIPTGPSLSDVVAGLNALGVAPRDMIDILKSIKAAGALHAEFVVQ